MDAKSPQPGIDLQQLDKVRRVVQYAATLAAVVTVILVVFASRKLLTINRELDAKQQRLNQADQDLRKANEDLKARQDRVHELDTTIKELEGRLARVNETVRTIEGAPTASTPTPAPGPPPTSPIPKRVYIQIFEDAQRARARELQRALEKGGFVVPGIENVGGRSSYQAVSDVRFYRGAADVSDIQLIREIAGQFDLTLKEIALDPSSRVRPRHYEVWLGKDFR